MAVPVIFLGLFVRFWANGYTGHLRVNRTKPGDKKVGKLVTSGPYAYVRHPLYFGSFLIGLGFCIIVGSFWFALASLTCLLLVYRKKIDQEERLISAEWPQEFKQYMREIPRWIPVWRPYRRSFSEWSWEGIKASCEWKTAIWTIVLLIGLYFREEMLQEHKGLFAERGVFRSFLLAAAVLLATADAISVWYMRRRKNSAAAPEAAGHLSRV